MDQLDFSKRKVERERTLLSDLNSVKVSKVIEWGEDKKAPVKVFEKNPDGKRQHNTQGKAPLNPKGNGGGGGTQNGTTDLHTQQPVPAAEQQEEAFMQMGGKGDQVLFGNDAGSRYEADELP